MICFFLLFFFFGGGGGGGVGGFFFGSLVLQGVKGKSGKNKFSDYPF